MQLPRFAPASDASVLVVVANDIGVEASARVHAWTRLLQRAAPPWLLDLHPAYTSLLVEFDLDAVGHAEVKGWLGERAEQLDDVNAPPPRLVELPVRYGGEDGPDLAVLAEHARLSLDEVVRRHAAATYTVAFLGFLPGFAYLLGLPASLRMPRLAVPRTRVPAGSVGIGDAQTGVYPAESPGGWRIIGRTERALGADWVAPGDRVRFVDVRCAGGAPS